MIKRLLWIGAALFLLTTAYLLTHLSFWAVATGVAGGICIDLIRADRTVDEMLEDGDGDDE